MPSGYKVFSGFILFIYSLLSLAQSTEPVADAGPDQLVELGTLVMLDGSGSSDSTGTGLAYLWEQVAGDPVIFINPTVVNPTFISPQNPGVLTFRLTVSNRSDQAFDTVDIAVQNLNTPPVSDAGDDFAIRGGASGYLDGSNSYDPDDDALTYLWIQIAGPTVEISDETAVNPEFSAPFVDANLVFHLVVDDGRERGIPDEVTVSITENNAPVADAGVDITVDEFSQVTLDGSASYDPDQDGLNFAWDQVSGPAVNLQFAASANPVFSAPEVTSGSETLAFELYVTDDYPYDSKESLPDTVTVNILDVNAAPNCDLAYPSSDILWPPNHKMQKITILGLSGQDEAYSYLSIRILGVTQDEPVTGNSRQRHDSWRDKYDNKRKKNNWFGNHWLGSMFQQESYIHYATNRFQWGQLFGRDDHKKNSFGYKLEKEKHDHKDYERKDLADFTSPDAIIMDHSKRDSVLLRAERYGNGNGRVYEITFQASNASGGCKGSVNVAVPHDRAHEVVDDGQLYDSTSD